MVDILSEGAFANPLTDITSQPIHYTWDRVLGSSKGHCVNVDALFIGSGSCNAALNLVVFILPIPLLWRLRATAKQQAILTIIFTLAGFGLLVSIIWIVVLAGREEMDVTWNYISTGIWSVLEPSMAVTCASIPSLRPLYSIAVGGFRNMSASVCRSNRMASNTGRTKRATWLHSGPLRRQPSDGMSSPNGKPADDIKPFGHGVSIRGGRQGDVGEDAKGMELPLRGIQVKTEVVITTEQLEYKDRLF